MCAYLCAFTQAQTRIRTIIPATEAASAFQAAGENLAKDLIAGRIQANQ